MKRVLWICLFLVMSAAVVSSAGEHTISFSKPGCETISDVIRIPPGVEVTVRGDLFEGEIENLYQGKGSLRVISTPLRCTVRIAGMVRQKSHPKLNLSFIPAGEYSIVLSMPGRELGENILILNRQRTVVEVDFSNRNEPIVVSYVPSETVAARFQHGTA